MPPYDLTIRLRLELADDAEAREACDEGMLQDIAETAGDFYNDLYPPKATAKLQRIYADRPPRLIAKWPSE